MASFNFLKLGGHLQVGNDVVYEKCFGYDNFVVYSTFPHVSAIERLNELMHEDVGNPKSGVLENDIYILSHRLKRCNYEDASVAHMKFL